ncbi:MAG: hypothetical protein Q8N23_36460 [Archangium sp.]|nr:hypothetical protein [Archangium sp.]MDP3572468.1 hypothetical protein [Archangium sp.]
MRRLLLLLPFFLGCPAPEGELVFELADGTVARDAVLDFGPRGGRVKTAVMVRNVSKLDVELAEPQLEGDAFLITGLASGTLQAGGLLAALIEFTPTGEHDGALRLTSSQGTQLASLSLFGHLETGRCALPAELDFGAVLPAERPQRSFDFPVLEVRRDVFVGPPGAPFILAVNSPSGTQSISAQQSLKARAQLVPPSVGEYAATWRIDPGPECEEVQLPLRATVLQRYLGASPTTVDFGAITPPGQPTATATLLNSLSRVVPVTLELFSSAGGPTTGFRMGLTQLELPAANRDAMGAWRPGEAQVPLSAWLLGAGTVTGKLVVTADTDVLEVPLVARGAGAGLLVTPSAMELGEVPEIEGERLSLASGVALSNDAPSAITVSQLTIEADPGTHAGDLCAGAFNEVTGVCQGLAGPILVAPGAQASLALRTRPTGAGPWRWFVVLHTDDVQQPEVRFEVTARLRPMADCVLTQPQAVSFGPVRAPTPMVRAVVLENQGLNTCVVQGLWIDGSADVRAGPAQFTVSPGERRLVDVEYLPTTAPGTSRFPTLRFSVNSVAAPVRAIPLEVSSDDGCLFISPEQWDFGVVTPSCGARVQSFGLGNRCSGANEDVVITSAQVSGSAAMTLVGMPPQRLAVSTFAADALRVAFDPSTVSVHAGVLELEVAVTGGTRKLRVPLRGRAEASGRQRDRFVMPSSADAVLIQDASPGAGEMQHGLALRADSLLALARARRASLRIGAVRADETLATLGQLREVDAAKWLSLDTLPASRLAELFDVGTAMSNPIEAFAGPALAALSGPGIAGFNAGFLRRSASLNVVSLSNAGEGSVQPMSVLLPQLAALKGTQRPEWLSWSAVGPFGAVSTGCTYDEASPNTLQRTAAQQLGGVVAEHCDIVRDATLFESSVAPTLFGARASLSLRAPLAPGALPNVTVGGVAVPEQGANMVRNWTFDVTRSAVTFTSITLLPGDVVELEYPTMCNP